MPKQVEQAVLADEIPRLQEQYPQQTPLLATANGDLSSSRG